MPLATYGLRALFVSGHDGLLCGACVHTYSQACSSSDTCDHAAAEAMAGSDEGSDRQGQQSDSPPASTSGRPPNPSRPFSSSHSKHEEDVLRISGQGYHVAHTVLLLSKMLQSYMTFQEAVPLLAAETARRAVELLKVHLLTHHTFRFCFIHLAC